MASKLHRFFCAGGIVGLAISLEQLFQGAQWIRPFSYLFGWWSYLFFIDGLNGILRGRSLMIPGSANSLEGRVLHTPWYAASGIWKRMCLVSVPWWLCFELMNLRLKNWTYEGVPEPLWIRWPGYTLAFATVLPAIFETSDFIRWVMSRWQDEGRGTSRPYRQSSAGSWLFTGSARRLWMMMGIAFVILPLAYPQFFFPLVWGAVVLILEPWLADHAPEKSWLRDLSLGRWQATAALLVSGVICGFLWEFLNYWAGGRWVYTVPWPLGPKLFEMPWLGYLGFPPFALECASFWASFEYFWGKLHRKSKIVTASALAASSICVFWFIDRWTVVYF